MKTKIVSGYDKGKEVNVRLYSIDEYYNLKDCHALCYCDSFGTRYNQTSGVINVKINGKLKTWKRNNNFKLPVKHGLYNFGYIEYTDNSFNGLQLCHLID